MPKKKNHTGNLILNLFFILLGVGLLGASALLIWFSSLTLPNLDTFDQRRVTTSTKIYDRTGEILLFDFHEDVTRTVVPAEKIGTYAKQASVAIEDARFYQHKGVEPRAIARAILTNLKNGNLLGGQGGSTITQQVIKNALLTSDKRLSRKLKEWVLSLRLEQEYNKDQILALYLNEIPYGGTIYGIEEASQSFFKKPSIELTLAESAYLAAIPQAPTRYSPFGNNTELLNGRKNTVLRNMEELGFITAEEREEAQSEEVAFSTPTFSQNSALHFVQYVREHLESKYGRDAVLNDGLRVITTLDFELQQKAEEIVLRNALENEESFNAENQGLIAIEAKTGQIITMVGSRDYEDTEIDGNFNVTLAKRQPGSSFKPFVYAAAFSEGYTDETILFDTKTQFSTANDCSPENLTSEGDCYSPNNYDGKEKGPLTLRNALAQSRNIPAVKLLYLVGISDAIAAARSAGITTLSSDPNQYGLTLVLGGGEVSLLDMTSAYTTFANEGARVEPQIILRTENNTGEVLEEFTPNKRQVFDREAARTLNSVLSDNAARSPLFGARSFMYFGENTDIAAKTGTTNDNRDAWLIGYSSELAVGVWSGNNNNSPMTKGSSISGKSWREFFLEANKKYPPKSFTKPSPTEATKPILRGEWRGGDTYTVDIISGKLATEYTPSAARFDLVITNPRSILHWIKPGNPSGEAPENPSSPQYIRWEYGVQKWLQENEPNLVNATTTIPTEYDDVHIPGNEPKLDISHFQSTVLLAGTPITLQPIIESKEQVTKVSYYLNNKFIGSTINQPFALTYVPQENDILTTGNTIKVILTDAILYSAESVVSLK